MRGVNSSYELLRINMKKNKKQFNTGKPTKHRKGRSISPSPDRFAIIRSLIRGKPKVLAFIQGQAKYVYMCILDYSTQQRQSGGAYLQDA
jgi:hypothetical protein